MTRATWPPTPPVPDPPFPPGTPEWPRTPWQPGPRTAPPGSASATASFVVGGGDWLAERLLDQRVVTLSGDLDADAVNRAVAELALLDATGDEPVRLRLSGAGADLDGALTLVDALDLVGAPVHATSLGALTGPAIAVLAVADRRQAGAHATFRLCEPRAPRLLPGQEPDARAAEHARGLARLQERLAEACGRSADDVAADMRAGTLLDTVEARAYGLLDD
ncbi:ATP-dependent Clp protease proteolytic subunit [Geodermatophilus sabuli]|uniref:ATP-dependent Clp protease proteolytic subunit n=1 Tax=Geodermatophilus sabuli TaxID=1564158 RepID=A0A7K3W418_9ACTN|nr:ATP-dependent Clp protease proteolytic subunit [Geodermatophilus sabuli]NEK59625.1 ATP-dependent Clp protease proteolytic subunit [Geodermatophilus sabuli]